MPTRKKSPTPKRSRSPIAKKKPAKTSARQRTLPRKKKRAESNRFSDDMVVEIIGEPVVEMLAETMTDAFSQPVVLNYDDVARRAFEIWERKTYTNTPEHNWREAEAELLAEASAKASF